MEVKGSSRSEFGSKLNYSIIPRTTSPSYHLNHDDHDDSDDDYHDDDDHLDDDNDDDNDDDDDGDNNDVTRRFTMDSIGFHLQRFIRGTHFLGRSPLSAELLCTLQYPSTVV